MIAKDRNSADTWIDPDSAPELDAEWAESAYIYEGDKMIKRGRGRLPLEKLKETVKVRYDQDVLDAFRASGKGWQTRMNLALRKLQERRHPHLFPPR